MSITGKEYAERSTTDIATAVGMRIAILDAMETYRELPADQQTIEGAKKAITQATQNNPYLESAGTAQTVANYYHDLFDRNKPEVVMQFLNEAKDIKVDFDPNNPPTKATMIKDALFGGGLPKAGDQFNAAAEKLGVHTLTGDFLKTLQAKPELAADLTTPKALTGKQAQFLQDTYELMGIADMRENDPTKKITGMISATSAEKEARLAPIIEAATGLAEGRDIEQNKQKLRDLGILTPQAEELAKDLSPQEMGENLLIATQRARMTQAAQDAGQTAQPGQEMNLLQVFMMALMSVLSPPQQNQQQGMEMDSNTPLQVPGFNAAVPQQQGTTPPR